MTAPSASRTHDFRLGGKDNVVAGRDTGGRMTELSPSPPGAVRDSPRFLCAAAARSAAVVKTGN